MEIQEHIPLAPFTTFQIGGPARFFARAAAVEELREAFAFAREKKLRTLMLGGGSNLLVSDEGFDGLVIKVELRGIEFSGTDVIAGAGELWDDLVAQCVEKGLWGIENLSGIPGTVGAAPVQNIGAYGAELKDTLSWVEVLEAKSGTVERLSNGACGFGYRTSRFKREPGTYVIVRAGFALSPHPRPNLSYADLTRAFEGNEAPSLGEIRAAVLAIRGGKFPDLGILGTAGSFFLNPVVSEEVAQTLTERFPELPSFRTAEGVKLSLAWLLDHALHLKGERKGGARLFEKQPLVIVAERNSSADDVRELAALVSSRAQKELNIPLESEVRVL